MASPASQTIAFSISGMTCPSCAKLMESNFKEIPGVTAAAVAFDPRTKKADARVTASAPATAETLQNAVRSAGYSVA